MGVYQHLEQFAGLPVATFHQETSADDPLPPAAEAAWYVGTAFDSEPFEKVFERFMERVDTTQVKALIIGYWGASYDTDYDYPVPLFASVADRFPNLRALFLGDITGEESEISWIEHGGIDPIFEAFPDLERFEVRGTSGHEGDIEFSPIRSTALKTLRFESGGLPARIVQAVGASDLPNLEHLDLWLGTENYGGDATAADLAPILSGGRLPALRHLGLEDSEIQNEVAAAVAGAPIVARLESLSLAMGTLTDQGAEALLSGQPLTHLKKLDLHHHFLSDAMMARVRAALPTVAINLDGQEEPDNGEWFFIEVSE